MSRRRTPPPSLHGIRQAVFDGIEHIGQIVRIGERWKAMASGGIVVGWFDEPRAARRAVLDLHRDGGRHGR